MEDEALNTLKQQVIHRDLEFDLLNAFITRDLNTCSPFIYIHGYQSVGKSLIVSSFLQSLNVKKTIINCDEILTTKFVLQSCLRQIRADSGMDLNKSLQFYEKGTYSNKVMGCETFSSFLFNLGKFVQEANYKEPHFLILDGLDRFTEDAADLISCFAKMRDCSDIENIFIIVISRKEIPHTLVTTAVPQIYVAPYSEKQIIDILQRNQFCSFGDPAIDGTVTSEKFWCSYVQVVVDLVYDYTGSNMKFLIDVCYKWWPPFIEPVVSGSVPVTDFLKIYRENRHLFLDDSLIRTTVIDYQENKPEESGSLLSLNDMTYMSKFILIAAYLASHLDPRTDLYMFTNTNIPKMKHKKRAGSEITKKDLDVKLLQPTFFDLERLFAIILVIYRGESKSFIRSMEETIQKENVTEAEVSQKQHEISRFTLASNIDIHSQISTLLTQGFLFRQTTRDILQPKTRWKSNVDWDNIKTIAESIDFPIQNFFN